MSGYLLYLQHICLQPAESASPTPTDRHESGSVPVLASNFKHGAFSFSFFLEHVEPKINWFGTREVKIVGFP